MAEKGFTETAFEEIGRKGYTVFLTFDRAVEILKALLPLGFEIFKDYAGHYWLKVPPKKKRRGAGERGG